MKQLIRFIFLSILMLFTLASCNSNSTLPAQGNISATVDQSIPSATMEIKPTIEKTKESTMSPRNTLSVSEKEERVSELIRTNRGCKLPCWWGITPGVTKGSEAISFLEEFTDLSSSGNVYRSTGYTFEYDYENQKYHLDLYIDKTDNISMILVHNFYSISDTLNILGAPSEVWFKTDVPLYFAVPVSLDFYYPNKGVIVSFYDVGVQYYDQGIVRFCRGDIDREGTILLLTNPSIFDSYYSIYSIIPPLPDMRIVDGSFSNWNASSLFEGLIDDSADACFSTEMKFWN